MRNAAIYSWQLPYAQLAFAIHTGLFLQTCFVPFSAVMYLVLLFVSFMAHVIV